jgi:hypothetical protein
VTDAVLSWSARELVRDERGRVQERIDADGNRVEVYRYTNPKHPEWPAADYIVGNPPFIGNKRMLEATIDRVLASLARLGHVHSSDCKTFALRRAV